MATTHSTAKRRRGRNHISNSRPRHTQSPRRPALPLIDRQALREGLNNHVRTVREAMFVAITCCDAMCHHNAGAETEVATVLRLYCGNQLYRAVQETGLLLALLEGETRVDPESDEITALADSSAKSD